MNARKRYAGVAGLLSATALLLVSCGGLPRALRNQIAAEKAGLRQADREWQQAQETV